MEAERTPIYGNLPPTCSRTFGHVRPNSGDGEVGWEQRTRQTHHGKPHRFPRFFGGYNCYNFWFLFISGIEKKTAFFMGFGGSWQYNNILIMVV